MAAGRPSSPAIPPTDPRRTRQSVSSLSDQVWERLRAAIIYGELLPGQRLIELEIAEQMGTSQGPVREALVRLEYEGLVERHARSGTFITPVSHDEMFELFSVRSLVEYFAIRRAVRRLNDDQLAELKGKVDLMRDAADRDCWAELVEHDMSFHRRLCEWSDSQTLYQIWVPLYSQIQRFINQTHPRYFTDLHEIAETHQPLIDVLSAANVDQAGDLIQEHVMLIWSKIGGPDRANVSQ